MRLIWITDKHLEPIILVWFDTALATPRSRGHAGQGQVQYLENLNQSADTISHTKTGNQNIYTQRSRTTILDPCCAIDSTLWQWTLGQWTLGRTAGMPLLLCENWQLQKLSTYCKAMTYIEGWFGKKITSKPCDDFPPIQSKFVAQRGPMT